MRKLLPLLLAGIVLFTSCYSTPVKTEDQVYGESRKRAVKTLKLESGLSLRNLPGGRITSVKAKHKLRTLAGIYAGTVKTREVGEGVYVAEGTYSQGLHPEALELAAEDADMNGDGIVTDAEARDMYLNTIRNSK